MIDTDRLELIDTGDGVPLTKCEQNLYEVLACQEDGVPYDPQRIYDAFEDMNELVAEVERLRKAIADIANNMKAADPSYLQGFIKDLLGVIE